jgi:hypothetical protein
MRDGCTGRERPSIIFASQILAPVNGNVTGGDAAADLLLNFVRNVVTHNFTLLVRVLQR